MIADNIQESFPNAIMSMDYQAAVANLTARSHPQRLSTHRIRQLDRAAATPKGHRWHSQQCHQLPPR
jgi:hypothetical protein